MYTLGSTGSSEPLSSDESSFALYPLTAFDKLFEGTTFVTGWLVEGTVNAKVLDEALRRVTNKWRMLAGRVQSRKEGVDLKWYLNIPLGPLPQNYRTFSLTTTTSTVPLSNYVPIPIPQISDSLPPEVFIHASTPRQYTQWESTSHPLTCWHLTYFPAQPTIVGWGPQEDRRPYTAIGFSRSHGVFDGVGASLVMRALVSELNGVEWSVPPMPTPGLNVNPVLQALEQKYLTRDRMYKGYTPLGVTGLVKLVAFHMREKWWRGAERQTVLLPKEAFVYLVESSRDALKKEGKNVENVSSGDILVAWIYKTIYAKGISTDTLVHCANFASFRSVLTDSKDPTDPLLSYAHNAFLPLPYPALSVSDVQSFSLHGLASILTASRLSLSKAQVVSAYKTLSSAPHFPSHPDAQDSLTISNVSASRILEADWHATGARRTVCGYRYQMTPTGVVFSNAIYIAGRLDDGSVVIDVTLNTQRMRLIEEEVTRLIDAAAAPPSPADSEATEK
ncbi:hypothetical protein D9611_002884 [Ephemerocybe angulata]|uniref:Uncharacterized protein n=1 Tax=Ephemerocybe angulata TaxID=980116 RepID=A0A8H5FHP1_9AGAR|nr:hypothetical protein D9611_002884 [Tulosesus angulatus]